MSAVREGSIHFSSETPEWETPQELFDLLNAEFGFTLDVCATTANAKCDAFYTEKDDGLAQRWTVASGSCWMNPPYGREIAAWIEKAHQEGDAQPSEEEVSNAVRHFGFGWIAEAVNRSPGTSYPPNPFL